MRKRSLIIICALFVFLMEPLGGTAGEVHGKGFQAELFGGCSLLNPADFNSIPIYHQKNLDFYEADRYAYWVQAGNIRSFSTQREGKFRRLASVLPFGFRLKYYPIKNLALSLGLRYMAVGAESRVSQRTVLTANDGTMINSTQSFEPLRIGVRAMIPSLGIHFGKSLTSKLGLEAFLSGGPLLGWIDYVREIRWESGGNGGAAESSHSSLHEMGDGAGISLEGGLRLNFALGRRAGLFLETGYAVQKISTLKGKGSKESSGTTEVWQGEWGMKEVYDADYWGSSYSLLASNYWLAADRLRKVSTMPLDLSGFQVRLGLSYRL